MHPTLARYIGVYKASSTSPVSRKEQSSDESGDDDHKERQPSKEYSNESPVDSVATYKASNISSACQLVGLCKQSCHKILSQST